MHIMNWEGLLDEAHSLRGRRGYLFTRRDKRLYKGSIYAVQNQGRMLFLWLDNIEQLIPGRHWETLHETTVCFILHEDLCSRIINDESNILIQSTYGPITIAPHPHLRLSYST